MAIAKIENDTIVQVDKTTSDAPDGWEVVSDSVVPGMVRDGDSFVAPEPTEEEKADQERQRLDAMTASRFQAKAALDDAGLLDQVEDYMAGDDVPKRVKLAWEEASFRRGSQMIQDIGADLGLSEEQIDSLFLDAQEIEA